MELTLINKEVNLIKTAKEWQKLEKDSPTTTVFQTFAWCQSWLESKAVEPFVITAKEQNTVVALAPLCRQKRYFGLPLTIVKFIATGPADYGGFILAEKEITNFNWLGEALQSASWDCLDLQQLNQTTVKKVTAALKPNLSWLKVEQEPCLSVSLPRTYEEFLASLSKKFKNNLLYAYRRLQREHQIKVKFVQKQAELNGYLNNFFSLHQKRWQKRKMPGLFFTAKNRNFHLKLAKKLLEEERLLLAELTADKTPIASLYGFKFNKTVYYYLGGFDPNWSKHSPLSLLLLEVIKQSIEQGYKTFDFLRGREPYKEKWGATDVPMHRLIVYRPTIKGRLASRLAVAENKLVQYFRQKLHS